MIRVLFVSEALCRNSGVASVIMNYVKHIEKTDIKIDLLTYKDGDEKILSEIKKNGVDIYYIPELQLGAIKEFVLSVDNFFDKTQYDIVHSHFNQIDCILFSIAKKHGIKNCISHSHNTRLSDSKLKSIRNRMMCLLLPYYAKVWAACSELAGITLYGKRFVGSSKSVVIHNGVDCDRYKFNEASRMRIRNELNISNRDIIIGHVGGFRAQKNHEFLIDIFKELSCRDQKYKLVLVGDGDLKRDIEKKVEELNLSSRVFFLGTREDIPEIMSAFDLFLLPSLYEGLPVVGIEAQANGLNCIFSNSITQEANLTNVIYLDLDEGPSKWCDIIETIDFRHHEQYEEMIIEKGYDIKTECIKLKKFYYDICK